MLLVWGRTFFFVNYGLWRAVALGTDTLPGSPAVVMQRCYRPRVVWEWESTYVQVDHWLSSLQMGRGFVSRGPYLWISDTPVGSCPVMGRTVLLFVQSGSGAFARTP